VIKPVFSIERKVIGIIIIIIIIIIIKHFKSSRYRRAKPVIPLKERARTPESPPIIQGFLLT
jgi:Na+/H+-translocating membrane pyrophosphatase